MFPSYNTDNGKRVFTQSGNRKNFGGWPFFEKRVIYIKRAKPIPFNHT
jgi:hypothetical protein